MIGKRVFELEPHEFRPGDFGQWANDAHHWYARTPTGLLANLSAHHVEEHENGTITVSPSILVDRGKLDEWHGYLERGVWRTV
jgi:hypothetical protein